MWLRRFWKSQRAQPLTDDLCATIAMNRSHAADPCRSISTPVADYSRRCLYAMLADSNGVPDPSRIVRFGSGASGTTALESGPGGDLYRVSVLFGEVARFTYLGPTARIVATPGSGTVPLVVQFDAATSTSQVPGVLDYAWDLDGDGEYDDSSLVAPLWSLTAPGSFVRGCA